MADPVTTPKFWGPPFYGWSIASALAVTQMTSWGVLYYAFAAVQTPLQFDTGWDRATVGGAFSLGLLASGVAAIPAGRLLDRFGGRIVMTAGSCAAAALVLAWSAVRSPLALYAVWLLIGVAMSAVLYEPAFAVVAHWFIRRRAWALTVLTVGGSLSGVVFLPLTGWLARAFGWRPALIILASLLAILTIPLHGLVLRSRPADLGLSPDGDPPQTLVNRTEDRPAGIMPADALRTPAYWWLTAAFALSAFIFTGLVVHLIPALVEKGYSEPFAAAALGLLGGSQVPGRLIFAWLNSRFSWQVMVIGIFGAQLLGVLILFAIPSQAGVLAFAAVFGAAAGAISPARAALLADFYGAAHYGAISGTQALVITAVRSAGPVGIALVAASAGAYQPVRYLLAVMASLALAAAIILTRAAPKTPG